MCEDSNDSKLQLGTEVKIIGPSRGGDARRVSEKFEISQIDISKSHGEFYSHEGFSWYPASSLQVVQKFKIGDWVEVIGECFTGDVFQIDETNESALGKLFSAKGRYWFSPKSLRKLTANEIEKYLKTELKVGDLVEIVGQPDRYPDTWNNEGKVDKIREVESEGRFWLDKTCLLYRTKSLRKLTPEEIEQHMQPKIELMQDALEKSLEQLSVIEKQQKDQDRLLYAITCRCAEDFSGLGKRLADVEFLLNKLEKRLELIK